MQRSFSWWMPSSVLNFCILTLSPWCLYFPFATAKFLCSGKFVSILIFCFLNFDMNVKRLNVSWIYLGSLNMLSLQDNLVSVPFCKGAGEECKNAVGYLSVYRLVNDMVWILNLAGSSIFDNIVFPSESASSPLSSSCSCPSWWSTSRAPRTSAPAFKTASGESSMPWSSAGLSEREDFFRHFQGMEINRWDEALFSTCSSTYRSHLTEHHLVRYEMY